MVNINLSKEEIINRIGYFRNKKNISAYKLGAELGHAKNYFYRVESGKFDISLETLFDVLQILDVSILEFLYPNLSKEQLKNIEKIIDEKN